MLAEPMACMRCPHCGQDLAESGTVLRCPSRHTYDVSRQGYVNLLPGDAGSSNADTAAMVAARDRFLSAGHFAPIADAVAGQAVAHAAPSGCLLDIGAGTGYYLASVLESMPSRTGIAADLSKHSARRAARAHPRMASVVADVWSSLPLHDRSVALIIDVFAPRNPAEFHRVLHPGGAVVVVTPLPDHLRELVVPLSLIGAEPDKLDRLGEKMGGLFERADTCEVTCAMALSHEDVLAVAQMGPSAWHTDSQALGSAVKRLPEPFTVTLGVTVSVFLPR